MDIGVSSLKGGYRPLRPQQSSNSSSIIEFQRIETGKQIQNNNCTYSILSKTTNEHVTHVETIWLLRSYHFVWDPAQIILTMVLKS